MNKIVIGIDTGLDGGLTIIRRGVIKETHLMPTFELPTKKKSKATGKFLMKRYVDAKKLVDILSSYPDSEVFIEEVHSLYGMSASSNFSMGQANGILQGIVRGLGYDYYLVKPKMWQKEVWIEEDKVYKIVKDKKKLDTKATSLNAATRHASPSIFIPKGCRTPKDGMFDSFLIAKYGEIYLKQEGLDESEQLSLSDEMDKAFDSLIPGRESYDHHLD